MKYLVGLIMLFAVHSTFAIEADSPMERASKAYLAKGVDAFMPALLKGSPLEGEKSVLGQSNNIRQIEGYYGAYQGYEVMYEKSLSRKVKLVFYVLNYEKSPVFGVATYYKQKSGDVVTNFNFNTELGKIVPNEVVFK